MTLRAALPSISRFTLGTASLGQPGADADRDLAVIRTALDGEAWIHTSREYTDGGAFTVLRRAIDDAGSKPARLIVKIQCDDADAVQADVEQALRELNIDRIDIAQLCRDTHDHRRIVDDLLNHGPMYETCARLQSRNLVGNYIFEVFPGFADDARTAVTHDLFDACTFYFNPLQRFAPLALWRSMQERNTPIFALRTLGGTRHEPAEAARHAEAAGKHQHAERLRQLQGPYRASGSASWPQFCIRYALSTPNVQTTIAGTASPEHCAALVAAAADFQPLDEAIMQQIDALHAMG